MRGIAVGDGIGGVLVYDRDTGHRLYIPPIREVQVAVQRKKTALLLRVSHPFFLFGR
jgi:hypothetical protein